MAKPAVATSSVVTCTTSSFACIIFLCLFYKSELLHSLIFRGHASRLTYAHRRVEDYLNAGVTSISNMELWTALSSPLGLVVTAGVILLTYLIYR